MTKTNVQPIPSNSQHHDTPNNKTHVIKFRVTAEEKTSLELTCKLLNLSLSTFIRRAIHNVKIEKTVIVAGGGEETLTAVSTLLAQCSKVGGNLNQLARHFNSGGADTEQIRAKLLDELADLTAFRLSAEKVLGELYRLMQQYGIAVKESRGQLSYLPSGRTKFIRAKHLGDKFEKELVLATLQENAERKRTVKPTPDRIGKLVDIQAKLKQGKGIGYERWAKKHNLKAMAQTLILLEEKGLTDEDALDQRITELDTKFHDSLAVVKDLEGRMKANKELRYHIAAYASTKNIAQQLKTAKRPVAFEEQHRAELTAHRAAAAYFKANDITKLPSPKKLEAEYAQLASEKAKFYEQYKEAKEELLKLKTAKQNVASFFREEEPAQQER